VSRSAAEERREIPPRSRQPAEGRGLQARGLRPHALRICTHKPCAAIRRGTRRERAADEAARRKTPESFNNQVVQPPGPRRKDATMTTTRPSTSGITDSVEARRRAAFSNPCNVKAAKGGQHG
jgi:hypothetical protein